MCTHLGNGQRRLPSTETNTKRRNERGVVVILVATGYGQDKEPIGLHCVKGHGDEEKSRKTDIGIEATTAGGEENINALVATSKSSGASSIVGDSDNVPTDNVEKPPILDIAGGDENIDVPMGALETSIQPTTVLDGDSTPTINVRVSIDILHLVK
ncbi:hypothetical protein Cgig2_010419 [Carnegiea gigantea]|uniref:Uncharacterized protein n=1 Tax=Carnegiea gigantea TaxID=171969 RepID=A0A9Q1JKI9_9CARY|nr:hypothetical protein Cgig2_010419 [Carnegiea gigantea]